MHRRCGNPHWGKPFLPSTVLKVGATEFEREVRRLGLTRENCSSSPALWPWCERHKNQCYIPEWLLKKWGMDVDADLFGAA